MKLRKLFIFSYVGWMERKKTLGEINITDRKKINLNLSNKIINENFKKQDIINSKSIKMEKDEVKITMLALM